MPEETPPVPAKLKPSASIILLREGEQGVELFVVRRNAKMRFAAGATAFPGGALDQQDIDFAGAVNPSDKLLPYQINAIRELFEETGLLFASLQDSDEILSAAEVGKLSHYRKPIVDGELSFESFLKEQQLVLNTDALIHFSKWIAPEMVKQRFATDFFLARSPADQCDNYDIKQLDTGEHDAAYWCPLATLMERLAGGEISMLFPTEMNCIRLMQENTVDQIIAAAVQPAPVVKTRAKKTEHGISVYAPPEAGVGPLVRELPIR